MDETWSDCKYLLENQIIFITFFYMTPLNPSKRVEAAKNACREADFGLFCPCNSLIFYHRAIKLKYNVSGNQKFVSFFMKV